MTHRILLMAGILLSVSGVLAQSKATRFQRITIEEGLPQNMVDCILQDSHGFMWFGTWNGVCRYDGYDFELFESDRAGQHKQMNNFIYCMAEDQQDNIWIGTEAGLYVYLYEKGQFLDINTEDKFDNDLINGSIRSIASLDDSLLVIGSSNGVTLLSTHHESMKVIKHFEFGQNGLEGSTVLDLFIAPNRHIWVGTDAGLYQITGNLLKINQWVNQPGDLNSLTSNHVQSVFSENSESIWVGTDLGLNHIDLASQEVSRFLYDPVDQRSLVHNSVMDLLMDDDGNLIVATLGGVSILAKDRSGFDNYRNEYQSEYSLSNDFVNSLYKDRDGNIWIGTDRGGVNFYNTNQNAIEHYEYLVDEPNSLSGSTINSIYEDPSYLWIGTAGGGLNRYDKKSREFKHFKNDTRNVGSISSDFVTSIFRSKNGDLWVGTWGVGLNKLVNEGQSNEYFERYGSGQLPVVRNNYISAIIEDPLGNLWIATLGGLMHYEASTATFSQVQTNYPMKEVGCLLLTNQQLLIGTRYGLFVAELDSDFKTITEVKKYVHDPDDPQSLSGNYVISITQDHSGQIWLGTYGQGLNLMIESNGAVSFGSYDISDGLSNNIIFGILEDDEQKLWMSTDYGLSRFDPETGIIRNFFEADGLLNNQYYWSAAYKNDQGKLYFGGMNGMDSFYPEWIKNESIASEVVITDILLINESVVPGREYNGVVVLESGAYHTDQINLSYREKNLNIEFSSLHYLEPELIKYAYILEGFEKEWNYVGSNRRFASYNNLKPGNYTFKVKASSVNGEFLSSPRVITIAIKPPFWETVLFQVIAIIVLVGLIYGYIRYRTYSLKRQKVILEKQVVERTHQINEQKEALSNQAVQLKNNNAELEEKQSLIEGQNRTLEAQNKEIAEQRDEVVKLNKKLEMVSQLRLSFFTNISHEFRTPLTLIIGPLERLMKETGLKSAHNEALVVMHRNAQRMLHLINQIMDFRKIEKGKMELKVARGNYSDFCGKICEAFQALADLKSIDFSLNVHDLPEEIWFDPQKQENILYNLLSNAFKYTKEGGRIQVEVKGLNIHESRLNKAELTVEEVRNVLSVQVIDSGIGISEENLPMIFKRFYRIDSEEAFKVNGSGIGLALTEELIKTHHGEIFVESKPGKGSTFEIQFPCLKSSYPSKERAEQLVDFSQIAQQVELLKNDFLGHTGDDSGSHEEVDSIENESAIKLLVVEDNRDLRKFLVQQFADDYQVLEAEDGEEGWKLTEEHNPNLVISDIMMPKIDGLELCARVKNNISTCHIPVILLSARSEVENQLEGLEVGADDYLPKPFNSELLTARVANLLEIRARLREQFAGDMPMKEIKSALNTRDQRFLEEAVQVVENQMIDSTFGPKELVTQMGVSRSLLHKKLTSLTNQSAAEFINHFRMKKARTLLLENELNVSEIAYAVGYNDPKYFSRVFSKYYGASPKEYISQHLEVN